MSWVAKRLRIYSRLSKDKLTLWVVLSTLPGYFVAGGPLAVSPLAALTIGTGLVSASANAFNQTYERHRDRVMNRTKARPVASGQITSKEGYTFGISTAIAGTAILAAGTNPITTVLGATNIAAYAGLYTRMKVKTGYNTHIGALVGSVPVLMGCAAAGMSLASPLPISLFVAQTLWQFPHFYALAWLHREDYLRGGFKMFPLDDETGKDTAKMILPWLTATTLFPLATTALGWTSLMFFAHLLIPNLVMHRSLYNFSQNPSKQGARNFFFHSLWQLGALLMLTSYHVKKGTQEEENINRNENENKESLDGMVLKEPVIHKAAETAKNIVRQAHGNCPITEVVSWGVNEGETVNKAKQNSVVASSKH